MGSDVGGRLDRRGQSVASFTPQAASFGFARSVDPSLPIVGRALARARPTIGALRYEGIRAKWTHLVDVRVGQPRPEAGAVVGPLPIRNGRRGGGGAHVDI